MFVAVEGPEGAGKTTLVAALAARLRAAGVPVVAVREPGGTPVAEAARGLVLSPDLDMTAGAELFLFLTARADLVERVVRPALSAGKTVLADRYSLSTVAYQVYGRGLQRNAVLAAIQLATGGLEPDLTLVLDIPPELSRARQGSRSGGPDRLEGEDTGFHERVVDGFRAAKGPSVVHLDGTLPIERVEEAAWRAVSAARQEGAAIP